MEAAISTWDDICHEHDDYALKLIEAVDRVPLAVNLLARLAHIGHDTSDSPVRSHVAYRWILGRDAPAVFRR